MLEGIRPVFLSVGFFFLGASSMFTVSQNLLAIIGTVLILIALASYATDYYRRWRNRGQQRNQKQYGAQPVNTAINPDVELLKTKVRDIEVELLKAKLENLENTLNEMRNVKEMSEKSDQKASTETN